MHMQHNDELCLWYKPGINHAVSKEVGLNRTVSAHSDYICVKLISLFEHKLSRKLFHDRWMLEVTSDVFHMRIDPQASPFYIGVGLCIGILKCRYCRGVWCATSEKIGAKSLGPLLESARQHPSTSVQGAALQYLSTWLNYPETAYLLRQWQPQEPDSLMESLLHSLAHPAMPVAAAAGNVCVGLINGNWPFTEDCFAIVFENLHPKKSVDVQRSTLTFVENVMCSSLSEENYSLLEETVSAQSMNEFCKESKDSLVHQCDEVDTATEGADIDESPKSTTSGTLRCNQLWFLPMVQYAVHYGLFSQDKLVIHHCINILSSLVAQSQRLSIAAPNWLNEVFLDSDATHRVGRLDTTLLFQSKGSLVFVLMKKLLCTHNQHQIPTLMHLAAALFDVAKMPPEWRQRLWKVVVLPLVRPLQRNTPRRSVDVCNTADAFASVYEMFGRELDADSRTWSVQRLDFHLIVLAMRLSVETCPKLENG